MWAEALGVAGLGVASAIIPLINIEAIIVLAAAQDQAPGWLLILGATVGQMVGKLFWYYGGRELGRFPFVAERMQRPRAKASLERWQRRSEGRPWFTAGVLFLSASVGIPPYAVLAVVAGALRVPLSVFLVTGLLGRAIRFGVIIGGTTTIATWW